MLAKRKGSILVLTMFVSAVLLLFAGVMLQQTVHERNPDYTEELSTSITELLNTMEK